MKKLIVILVVTMLAFIGIVNLPFAIAAPGDVTITLTIPAAKVADFRVGFLAICPNNETVEDSNDPNILVPKYTDKQWIKVQLLNYIKSIYRRGKYKLANEAMVVEIDNDVIQ